MHTDAHTPKTLGEIICNLTFRKEKSRTICKQILDQIVENGYAKPPRRSLGYYVARKLIETGIVQLREIPVCTLGKTVRVLVLNFAFISELYSLVSSPKLPPFCIEPQR